jgi:protein-S-isoprenylcysteine O-methyltransferase Ste14
MRPDPQRIAADAANHVTIGFLQGTGFALAGVIVGLVISMLLRHPAGFLAGVAFFAWLFVRAKRRNRNLLA